MEKGSWYAAAYQTGKSSVNALACLESLQHGFGQLGRGPAVCLVPSIKFASSHTAPVKNESIFRGSCLQKIRCLIPNLSVHTLFSLPKRSPSARTQLATTRAAFRLNGVSQEEAEVI